MRILLLTQWFDPEPIPKGLSFAKELARRGHEVSVLTGYPHYPTGKIYEGYFPKACAKELIDGIAVTRTYEYASQDHSAARRSWTYISFAVSAAVAALRIPRPDVVYVYHPPASIALPALVLRIFRGVPFVYDVQDLWPETLGATQVVTNRWILGIIRWLCGRVYRIASRVIVLSPGFKAALIARGVPQNKVHVIYNWSDEDRLVRCEADSHLAIKLGLAGRFNVVFSGNMGVAQALDTVLDVAARALNEMPRMQFVFVGGGTEVDRLRATAATRGLQNVMFLPRRPMSEIGQIHALGSVLLVHLKDEPLFRITIPSKTQAYMASGRPIVMAVAGDAAALVQEAACGVCCDPEDSDALFQALQSMYLLPAGKLQELGDNGFEFYRNRLALRAGADSFEAIFREVAEGNQ